MRALLLALAVSVTGCGGDAALQLDARSDAAPDGAADAAPDAAPDAAIDAGVVPPLPEPSTIAGPLTLATWGNQPFLTPAPIVEVLQSGFSIGREMFVASWLAAPNAQRPNIDGLGPLHHATSCVACHPATGRPRAFAGSAVDIGILFRLVPADPVYGGQLQPLAIPGVTAEAAVTVELGSGKPVFTFATTGPALATHASARLSPQLAGMGLLEVAELPPADPEDGDGDGISGRASARGRFGWKAVQPTLIAQTSAAFAGDLGITSPLHPSDDCTAAQSACLAATHGGDPEIGDAELAAVATFNRFLGVPAARRANADPQMVRGHAVFFAAGCAACHTPTLTARSDAPAPLANVTFAAYTDLMLHDMGPGLADAVGEGDASAAEWRTPPLWGIGLVAQASDARFLHDGRAASVGEAIPLARRRSATRPRCVRRAAGGGCRGAARLPPLAVARTSTKSEARRRNTRTSASDLATRRRRSP